ncbi:MAG TPA: hypothetical protein VM658_16195 [bacterium]|nr:hypothetical protein [bacterium]
MKKGIMQSLRYVTVIIMLAALSGGCQGTLGGRDDLESAAQHLGALIQAKGGQGDELDGGSGGAALITAGPNGLVISPEGSVDTSFNLPLVPAYDLGDEAWTVTGSYTVNVYIDTTDSDANADDGEYLLFLGDTALYRRNGVDDYTEVTGLKVNRGVVLTVGLNSNFGGGNSGQDTAQLVFEYDVVIFGTVKPQTLDTGDLDDETIEDRAGAPATDMDMGALSIRAYRSFLYGKMDASGADATVADQRGGYGGLVNLAGDDYVLVTGIIDASGGNGMGDGDGGDAGWNANHWWGARLQTYTGAVVNRGTILANGGNGANGGNASFIRLVSAAHVFNTGTLMANGGRGSNGDGGDGADSDPGIGIQLQAPTGSIFNSGNMSANGGNAVEAGVGGPVEAGSGGLVDFQTNGDIRNSGAIVANGGNASVDGNGGSAGEARLVSGFSLYNDAPISLAGGNAAGTDNIGGEGGALSLEDAVIIIDVKLVSKGAINLNGGVGDQGGPGGSVQLSGYGVELIGYSGLILDAGNGGINGGNAAPSSTITSAGDVAIQNFLISARGGVGLDGNGGYAMTGPGGLALISSANLSYQGAITLVGGRAADGNGGSGGGLTIQATSGDLSFKGGIDLSGGGAGGGSDGDGGSVVGTSINGINVTLDGTLVAAGGRAIGGGTGGSGPMAQINAVMQVISNMSYNLSGGNADLTSGTGGNGGMLGLKSNILATQDAGHWNVAGGNGLIDGDDGLVVIDGIQMFP